MTLRRWPAGVAHALRSRTAVVCRPGAAAAPAPATAAARRLARRLGARDHAVTTAGTLCHVSLPGDPESAIRELWRLAAALDRTPLVLALSTRNEAFDAVLAQLDRLSLSAPADVAELALASLSALGPPTQLVAPPSGPIARRLAALGLTAARPVPKEIAA